MILLCGNCALPGSVVLFLQLSVLSEERIDHVVLLDAFVFRGRLFGLGLGALLGLAGHLGDGIGQGDLAKPDLLGKLWVGPGDLVGLPLGLVGHAGFGGTVGDGEQTGSVTGLLLACVLIGAVAAPGLSLGSVLGAGYLVGHALGSVAGPGLGGTICNGIKR